MYDRPFLAKEPQAYLPMHDGYAASVKDNTQECWACSIAETPTAIEVGRLTPPSDHPRRTLKKSRNKHALHLRTTHATD